MLSKQDRLKDKFLINLAFKKKQKLSSKLFSLYYLLKPKDINRFNNDSTGVKSTFIAPLKIDKRSTKRNLVKRRMNEAYKIIKSNILIPSSKIKALVFIAHPAIKDAAFGEIKDTMGRLLSKLVKFISFNSRLV